MPSHDALNSRGSLRGAWIACWDNMEACGFTDIDKEVVLAKFLYREENRLLVQGKGQFDDPLAWIQALEQAKEGEQRDYAELTEKHGYPDTSSLPPQEAHFARLAFLMTKYPDADWDLLMEGQESAMDRKPSPMPVPQVTVQGIERTKKRFLALRNQRAELIASGENPELLTSVIQAMGRNRSSLERWGISIADLIASGASDVAVMPSAAGSVSNALEDNRAEELPVVQGEGNKEEPETPTSTTSAPAEPKTTMTAKEVSDRIGMTYQTAIRMLASGELPYGKRVGRNWIVAREPFLSWIDSNDDTVRELSAPRERKKPQPKATEPTQPRAMRHGRNATF